MLYTKARYGRQIQFLSNMSRLLRRKRHAHLGSRMGYRKYSSSYYALCKRLYAERILDLDGQFVRNLPNDWLAELPLHAGPDEMRALGSRPAYEAYLALALSGRLERGRLVRGLDSSPRATYAALRRLEGLSLVRRRGRDAEINAGSKVLGWLTRYLGYALVYADSSNDIRALFDCVPGYLDGPEAHFHTHYEPGRPLGALDMIIRTNPLFEPFWRRAMESVRHFSEHPRKLELLPARPDAVVVDFAGLPTNSYFPEWE